MLIGSQLWRGGLSENLLRGMKTSPTLESAGTATFLSSCRAQRSFELKHAFWQDDSGRRVSGVFLEAPASPNLPNSSFLGATASEFGRVLETSELGVEGCSANRSRKPPKALNAEPKLQVQEFSRKRAASLPPSTCPEVFHLRPPVKIGRLRKGEEDS